MAEKGFKRKLTAILSADVVGYSRLIGEDEDTTVRTLTTYRNAISSLIKDHKGRVVDSSGDNILAEFFSVVSSLRCAWDVQQEIKSRNAELPENRRMNFRIGINLGDVIQEEDRIYGDGVNIAARLESIAEESGICISGTAYDQVKNKLPFRYEYQGEQMVKNISEPVRVYKVLIEKDVDELILDKKLELPDKPSIAVLPFVNMSGDPSQEYFSDGLTEQIINGLCKVSNLFVIARNSSFAYKGKQVNVQQVGKELGVRYVLEGSVQKAGERVRITAQLIDSTTGYHLWSENYDRDLSDIFALQDEITLKLINIMQIKLTFGEQARLWEGATTNIQAYDKFMRGNDCFFRLNEKDIKQAQQFYKEAIDIDKAFALAYAMLGFTHMFDLMFRWSESPIQSFEQAERCSKNAFALNESLDIVHLLLGWINLFKRQHDEAIKDGKRAIELNPNGAEAHAHFAFILCLSDEIELAIKLLKRAFRLNPIPQSYYYIFLSMAYRNNEQYEKAIEASKKGLSGNPDQLPGYLVLAACYSLLNLAEKARNAVEEVLRINPSFSLEHYANTLPYKNQETLNKYIEALRKAGLPD